MFACFIDASAMEDVCRMAGEDYDLIAFFKGIYLANVAFCFFPHTRWGAPPYMLSVVSPVRAGLQEVVFS